MGKSKLAIERILEARPSKLPSSYNVAVGNAGGGGVRHTEVHVDPGITNKLYKNKRLTYSLVCIHPFISATIQTRC